MNSVGSEGAPTASHFGTTNANTTTIFWRKAKKGKSRVYLSSCINSIAWCFQSSPIHKDIRGSSERLPTQNTQHHSSINLPPIANSLFLILSRSRKMISMDYELDLSGLNISIDPVNALKPVYRIMQKLSMTGCGAVFLAEDRNQSEYAVKVQKVFYKNPRLRHERNILDRLYSADPEGFPKVFNYLHIKDHEFLVMQRMGPSLQDLLEETSSRRLSKKSVIMFGIQAVKRLQTIHENRVLHRDIKPANFLIGSNGQEGVINVVDFGISTIVDDWRTYNPDGPCAFCGTVPFASTEALLEKRPTRAGDLESLVYTLIMLFAGELPFSFPSTEDQIHDTVLKQIAERQRQSVDDICVKFPDITNFTRLVFNIEKREKPDYNGLVRELERVLIHNRYTNDGRFEWM